MKLHAHEPRVIAKLHDLHALAAVILADEIQPGLCQTLDVSRVDFVAVTVAFVDGVVRYGSAVQFAEFAPLAAVLEDGRPETETHGAAEGGFVDFGHEDDDGVGGALVEFDGGGVRDVAYVAGVFDDGELHAETDSEIGGFVLAGPVGRGDHAFGASMPETAWNEDSVGGADFVPSFVVVCGGRLQGLGLEMGRIYPDELELFRASHGGMFEGFDDREI